MRESYKLRVCVLRRLDRRVERKDECTCGKRRVYRRVLSSLYIKYSCKDYVQNKFVLVKRGQAVVLSVQGKAVQVIWSHG